MKIIALCGWPKSGKDTAARVLADHFGATIVDDALPLRTAAPLLFAGVDLSDAYTQEGKDKLVEVSGQTYTVRKLLGDLGQLLEDHYGEFYVPEQVLKRVATLAPAPYFVMPSVRKRQTHFYRERGALVLEMKRDVKKSEHAFDWYDSSACHGVIDNMLDLPHLKRSIARLMSERFEDHSLDWALS